VPVEAGHLVREEPGGDVVERSVVAFVVHGPASVEDLQQRVVVSVEPQCGHVELVAHRRVEGGTSTD
jgi:hypothetical protein